MKAELTEDGCMVVTAESPLEAYALRRWCDSNFIRIKGDDGKEVGVVTGESMLVRMSSQHFKPEAS